MTNRQKIYVLVGVGVLLFSLLFYFPSTMFLNKDSGLEKEGVPASDTPFVSAQRNFSLPDSSNIIVPVPDGNVLVNNPYLLEGYSDEGRYVFGEQPGYYISMGMDAKDFLINVYSGEFSSTREEAEAYFLKVLGISKEDSCRLQVAVLDDVLEDDLFGKTFRLSFCGYEL